MVALIALKVETAEADNVASEVAKFPEVEDDFLVTGDTDIYLKARFPHYEELKEFVLHRLPGGPRDPGVEDAARRHRLQGRRGDPQSMTGANSAPSNPSRRGRPAGRSEDRSGPRGLPADRRSAHATGRRLAGPEERPPRGPVREGSAHEAPGRPRRRGSASAVYVLDDLANDANLPTHGRTAIWSIISSLESLQ